MGFGVRVGLGFYSGVVGVVCSADRISFGLDDGSDMGSSCGYFDSSNYWNFADSFLYDHFNKMM